MPELHDLVANWFLKRRGIRRETVEAFGIYTEGNDIVIPYSEGKTKRRYSMSKTENPFGLDKGVVEGDLDSRRMFKWEPPGETVPFLPPDFEQADRMVILEGETDTMALYQALQDAGIAGVTVIGLSGLSAWKPEYAERLLNQAKRVFVMVDNDDPYTDLKAAENGEKAWRRIRADLGKKARRVHLPQGTNDVCEFLIAYNWAAFQELLIEAARPRYHYPALDLTLPPPPTDWLVKDMIEMGVITVITGDSGSGKSYLTQALTVDLLNNAEHFLAQEILKPDARILYLDEENHPDLVQQRLKALGFNKSTVDRLRYINRQGVNLAAKYDWFLEDALEFEPTAVFIDSQSRIAIGVKENNNEDLTEFYHYSILPIAVQTNAATIVLHHTPKDGSGPRGGSAIRAVADQALTLVVPESGGVESVNRFNMFPDKPRRMGTFIQAEIVGDMDVDGWVRVQTVGDRDAM